MDDYVVRAEYEERLKRVDDENNRQNRRLDKLEDLMEKINELTISVKELATSMSLMQPEPADKWKTTVKTVITVAVSALITYMITKGGLT